MAWGHWLGGKLPLGCGSLLGDSVGHEQAVTAKTHPDFIPPWQDMATLCAHICATPNTVDTWVVKGHFGDITNMMKLDVMKSDGGKSP